MEEFALNSGNATGTDGSAASDQDSQAPLKGRVVAVGLAFHLSDAYSYPASVIVKTRGGANFPPSQTLLSLSGVSTDGWYPVRQPVVDYQGNAIADQYDEFAVADYINVSIDGVTAGDNVDVTILAS